MTKRSTFALYDGPAEIGALELERIVQGVLWLGDSLLLPRYVCPSRSISEQDSKLIANKLGELAEAGYVKTWTLDGLPESLRGRRWWPGGTTQLCIPREAYLDMQKLVAAGVTQQKSDLLRGLGRPPGSMISGVAELVSLRETLTMLGVARYFDAEILVSSDSRATSLTAPLRLLKEANFLEGPVTETLLRLNGVGGLGLLPMKRIKQLRRRGGAVRSFVTEVLGDTEPARPFTSAESYRDLLNEVTATRFAELAQAEVNSRRRDEQFSAIAGTGVTLAGTVFPPLGVAGFAQPILSWTPGGRQRRRLLVFLTKLKRASAPKHRPER